MAARNGKYTVEVTEVDELKSISVKVRFDISYRDKQVQDLTDFMQNNSPEFDRDLQESKVLVDHSVTYLTRIKCVLIGDDFNFMADRYNDLRIISKAIDSNNLWFNLA